MSKQNPQPKHSNKSNSKLEISPDLKKPVMEGGIVRNISNLQSEIQLIQPKYEEERQLLRIRAKEAEERRRLREQQQKERLKHIQEKYKHRIEQRLNDMFN